MSSTPKPDQNAASLSQEQLQATERCACTIQNTIKENGLIGFDEYMQLALHDSEVGYYCQQKELFGKQGDFTTVPETSIHLAFCLAHACAKLIQEDRQRCIVEIGAGSGRFACDIVKFLSSWGWLPSRYYIYEPSEPLRNKQLELLQQEIPEFIEHVEWVNELSNDCSADDNAQKFESAIVIANEVLDALPVKCFEVGRQEIFERYVALDQQGNFNWLLKEPTENLAVALSDLMTELKEPLGPGYQSEINLNIEPALRSWANSCKKCVMFLIDYGQPCHEYYHPQRNMGTLRSYFKHQVSEDVFTHPGLQDITADIDFSAVAKVADTLDMNLLSFGSQRNFMLANHLLEWQPSADNEIESLAQIAQLKQLTLGSAISERFQVMVLGKGISYDTNQFTMRDMRARL